MIPWLTWGLPASARSLAVPPPNAVDVALPSSSTGSDTGTLAVRVQSPAAGDARYSDGAPVIIWLPGGFEMKGLAHELPPSADDVVIVTFAFPGDDVPNAPIRSDGVYDYRGLNCIRALSDVILYAAGELTDDQGRTIDEVTPVDVLHDNIGLIGVSNGGNIIVSVAALHGEEFAGCLRYVIQWETPVSSQIATRDFGRVWLKPSPQQGDYFNPRYTGYDSQILPVDYADLAYDPAEPFYRVFHDGNGDGVYTTLENPNTGFRTPDLDRDEVLGLDEDFPLDGYPDGSKAIYSRPVSHALADKHVLPDPWPEDIATPAEADVYWDIRESVRLYDEALANIPDLQGMVLGSVRDHVQSAPDKPHLRQAFDGWHDNGAWVQINPSPAYLVEADPALEGRSDLPDNAPNTPPGDWGESEAYCISEDVPDGVYQLAAVWQMADRVRGSDASPGDEREPGYCGNIVPLLGLGVCAAVLRFGAESRLTDESEVAGI
jgi:hypothetical protein